TPPLLLFSLADSSSTAPAILASDTVVVHFLDETNADLARLCATRGADRFAGSTPWTRLVTGEPLYTGVRTWLRGSIEQRVNVGGSTVVVVRALEAATSTAPSDVKPLVYHDRSWHRLDDGSRVPRNA